MKNICLLKLLTASVLLVLLNTESKAQYYKKSSKNLVLLNSNAYAFSHEKMLYNTFEIGKEMKRLVIHGGFGLYNQLEVEDPDMKRLTTYNATAGCDLRLLSFRIKNLSRSTFCKILGGTLKIGVDANKNLKTPMPENYGYRSKLLFDIYLSRSGSNKKDIEFSRTIEIGYCHMNLCNQGAVRSKYHCIMFNLMISKNRLIKFADWY